MKNFHVNRRVFGNINAGPNNLDIVNELKQAFYNSSVGSQLKALLGRFGRGGEWDIQRPNRPGDTKTVDLRLFDGANFNIGYYAAHAGISEPIILGIANMFSLDSDYGANKSHDSVYRFLSSQDADGIRAGYRAGINKLI